MKYLPLVWVGLWHKPARTIFTFLSVAIAFVLFGILHGVDVSQAHLIDAMRLDRLYINSRFGGPLPVSYADRIEGVPGVIVVAPMGVVSGYYQDQKNRFSVVMSDARWFGAHPEIDITQAQIKSLTQTRTGIVISVGLAKKYGVKVGDKLPLTSNLAQNDGNAVWVFDILAIVDDTRFPENYSFAIGNYAYLDEARGSNKGTVEVYETRIKDAARSTRTSQAIDKLFANSSAATITRSERSGTQAVENTTFNIGFFTKAVVGAVFFTLLFLTANTMMQSVRERTPEFAVLKTMGLSDTRVLALVLAESGLLCTSAALIGLGIARATMPLAKQFTGYDRMPPIVLLQGIGAALLVALVSAALPAWRARGLVIVDALAGR